MRDDLLASSEDPYPDEADIDGPTVDVPDAAPGDVGDDDMTALFVLHVLVWNAVLLVASLGVMLIAFRGNWTTGGQLLVVGAVLALYGIYRWPDLDDEDDESER